MEVDNGNDPILALTKKARTEVREESPDADDHRAKSGNLDIIKESTDPSFIKNRE